MRLTIDKRDWCTFNKWRHDASSCRRYCWMYNHPNDPLGLKEITPNEAAEMLGHTAFAILHHTGVILFAWEKRGWRNKCVRYYHRKVKMKAGLPLDLEPLNPLSVHISPIIIPDSIIVRSINFPKLEKPDYMSITKEIIGR